MDVAPHPERVLALRDLLGFSLQEIGAATGLSQGYLSDMANGNRPFTDQHAKLLASALDFPQEFFYVRAPVVESSTLNFRKLKKAKAKDTKKASQYFREASRVTQVVADAASLTTKDLPSVPAEAPLLSDTDIECAASATRALMGVGVDDPVPNLTRAIERLGIVVAPVILDPTNEEETPVNGFEGHFGISHGTGAGYPVVGYFPGASPDRDRFTLSHEIGHVVLHSARTSSDPEHEANRFAGALLIPEGAARTAMHSMVTLNQLAHVKAQFGISIQALIMRAAALGIIDERRQRSLFVQLSARGWRHNEPVEVEPEYPLLMRKLIELTLPTDPTTREIEKRLGLPRAYIRAMAPLPPKRRRGSSSQPVSSITR
jgi:Zn-dependent peptidase ImmA (M78 family)